MSRDREPVAANRRWGRTLRLALVCALCAGLYQGCTIRKPQVPSTDFTISLPVADELTTIRELATDTQRKESDYLSIDDASLLALDFSADFGRREQVGDRLRVRPTANSFATPIGDIALPGQELPEIVVSMSTLLGQDVPDGTVPVIPAADIDHSVAVPLDDVQSVVIKKGGFSIDIVNGLPIALQGLELALVDRGNDGVLVSSLNLGTVASGATASGDFDLSGKSISGDLQIGILGYTAQATDVQVSAASQLVINSSLQPLVVTSATAIIPQQEFADRQVLTFPDDRILVQRAAISEGALTLQVRNDIPVLMEVEFSLDELRRSDGSVVTFLVDGLRPNETRDVRFDLGGSEFAPDNPRELKLSYAARTVASGTPVTIESGGEIAVRALTEDLVFSRVEGVLNQVQLPVEPVTAEVDIPRGLDNLSLQAAYMRVFIRSAVGFRSRIDLDIRGTNLNGDTAELQVSEVFERGSPHAPVSIVVEPSSSQLTELLNLLPTEVEVRPTVLLGDGAGTEVIEPSHWVQIDSVQFIAPARFTVKASTDIRPDPDYRDLQDEEARRRIESNLISAAAILNIENHLPLGVSVSLCVTSWQGIVRGVITQSRPDLADDEALLDWLVAEDAWRLLSGADKSEIQERVAAALGLDAGELSGGGVMGLVAVIDARGSATQRRLLTDLILGALENDTRDGRKAEVESLLGVVITEPEWDEIIASSVYEHPELTIPPTGGPFLVDAAPSGTDGAVTESQFSRREIELTKDEVVVFLRKGGVYTGVLTQISETAGDVVLLADDYVKVQAATKVHMELNEDLVQD